MQGMFRRLLESLIPSACHHRFIPPVLIPLSPPPGRCRFTSASPPQYDSETATVGRDLVHPRGQGPQLLTWTPRSPPPWSLPWEEVIQQLCSSSFSLPHEQICKAPRRESSLALAVVAPTGGGHPAAVFFKFLSPSRADPGPVGWMSMTTSGS
jgi:hypothetical protein